MGSTILRASIVGSETTLDTSLITHRHGLITGYEIQHDYKGLIIISPWQTRPNFLSTNFTSYYELS